VKREEPKKTTKKAKAPAKKQRPNKNKEEEVNISYYDHYLTKDRVIPNLKPKRSTTGKSR
jgi:hypothetical protein